MDDVKDYESALSKEESNWMEYDKKKTVLWEQYCDAVSSLTKETEEKNRAMWHKLRKEGA
jgi:hypothetical protein